VKKNRLSEKIFHILLLLIAESKLSPQTNATRTLIVSKLLINEYVCMYVIWFILKKQSII